MNEPDGWWYLVMLNFIYTLYIYNIYIIYMYIIYIYIYIDIIYMYIIYIYIYIHGLSNFNYKRAI